MGVGKKAQAKGSGCSHSLGSREMQRKVLDQISHFLGWCWVFVWNMGTGATVTSCANERTGLPATSEEDPIPAATNQPVQAPRGPSPSTCPMAVPTQAVWGTSLNKHFGQVELYINKCINSNWSWKEKDSRSSTGFTHHPPLPPIAGGALCIAQNSGCGLDVSIVLSWQSMGCQCYSPLKIVHMNLVYLL